LKKIGALEDNGWMTAMMKTLKVDGIIDGGQINWRRAWRKMAYFSRRPGGIY
jgi:hypothetical protein